MKKIYHKLVYASIIIPRKEREESVVDNQIRKTVAEMASVEELANSDYSLCSKLRFITFLTL